MTRVRHARPQDGPQRSGPLDQSRAALKKKKPYKIVLEAVTQEKKKLHSILTYASNAPTGFGFIPAGHPDFTEWCKEQCRQRNLDVHIVSAKPKNKMHADPEKLSHHVHRVGHHFPLEIIQLACSKFGYTYDERRGLRKAKDSDRTSWIAQRVEDYSSRQLRDGRPSTEKETKDYIHGAVREMFPKIPEADLSSIVNHAFQEGTNRVGNAKELSLARRVQLAVVAHIRHTYTDYDKLLKTGGWMEARSKVEHVSLAKLKEWRDEAGEQSNELEETFREVIVLDDDDEVTSDDGSLSTPDEREQSMEIVSSRATARDLQPERSTDYRRIDVHDMRRVPRRTIVVRPHLPPPRSAILSGPSYSQSMIQQAYQPIRQFHPASESPPPSRGEAYRPTHSRPVDPRTRPAAVQPGPRKAPVMLDGRLYELEPISDPRDYPRVEYDSSLRVAPRRAPEGYVQSPARPISFDRPPAHAKRPSEQDVVLPSVEHETVDLMSPRRNAEDQRPLQDQNPQSRAYVDMQSSKRKAIPTYADDREAHFEHGKKRPRPVYREDEIRPRPAGYQTVLPGSPSYQSMDARSHQRIQPPQQVIDLTSSPYRPPVSGDRGSYKPVRSYPVDPDGYAYVSMPARRSPMREVRGAYYDAPAEESSRAYIPDNRMYDERAPPARDYIPLRDERPRPRLENEGARYLRNGVKYGG
ncbi:Nn.00g115090.m01.CDS01 [Neocucurbitaria sp. VM-36]